MTDQFAHQTCRGSLRRFEIDEPIEVRFGQFRGSEELHRCCHSLAKPASDGATLTLVVCLPDGQPTLSLTQLLDHSSAADRVVLTSVNGSTIAQWPITFGDLRAEADHRKMRSVCLESDAGRAVIGSMQCLNAEDLFVVLFPVGLEQSQVINWLTQGARWRGSLEQPDDDQFHHLSE